MAAGIGKTRAPKRLPMGSLPAVTVAGFSGGKDSTAMVLRLAELGEDFACLFTPTGNELPDLKAHMQRVMTEIAPREMVFPPNRSLAEWIDFYGALPNWRQRWCTRQIKVAPCAAYLAQRPGSTLLVGLRADEPEREGLYGPYANYRYPLREWGWGLAEVWGYLESRGVDVPTRTDCAVCPYQRLGEWFALWRDNPEHYAEGVAWEKATGHTFRSPNRDTWPADLESLALEFAAGRRPRPYRRAGDKCRVCSL